MAAPTSSATVHQRPVEPTHIPQNLLTSLGGVPYELDSFCGSSVEEPLSATFSTMKPFIQFFERYIRLAANGKISHTHVG